MTPAPDIKYGKYLRSVDFSPWKSCASCCVIFIGVQSDRAYPYGRLTVKLVLLSLTSILKEERGFQRCAGHGSVPGRKPPTLVMLTPQCEPQFKLLLLQS